MSANHFERVGIGIADRCLLSVIDVERHDDEVPLTVVVVPGGVLVPVGVVVPVGVLVSGGVVVPGGDVETDVDQ